MTPNAAIAEFETVDSGEESPSSVKRFFTIQVSLPFLEIKREGFSPRGSGIRLDKTGAEGGI